MELHCEPNMDAQQIAGDSSGQDKFWGWTIINGQRELDLVPMEIRPDLEKLVFYMTGNGEQLIEIL